jgi:hypothetical protein
MPDFAAGEFVALGFDSFSALGLSLDAAGASAFAASLAAALTAVLSVVLSVGGAVCGDALGGGTSVAVNSIVGGGRPDVLSASLII